MILGLLVIEIFTHVLGTVGYVAIAGYSLWLSKHHKQIQLVTISATVLLIVGYILAIDLQHPSNQATFIVNRVSALVVIWFAYYFTLRYRKTQENEYSQRIELEERRLAEARLRSSLEIYEAIARNFPVGWIGILDETMAYSVAGGKGLRTGIKAMEIIGQNFSHVLETDIAEPFLMEALDDKHVLFEITYNSQHFCLYNPWLLSDFFLLIDIFEEKEGAKTIDKKLRPFLMIKHFKNGEKDNDSQRGFYAFNQLQVKCLDVDNE